jgi:hypothetical protein
VQAILGLSLTNTSETKALNLFINQISAAVAERLGRDVMLLSNAANPLTQFVSGRGEVWLLLKNRPVYTPILTGTTTSGSSVVTGIPSTAYLFAGQPVTGPALPLAPAGTANVSIQSIDSSSQVTLTANAAATATGTPLYFGVNAWEDINGYFGAMPGSFASGTQLTWGSDFGIRADLPDGSSRSGMLLRINQVWNTHYLRGGDMLSSMNATGMGNIRVQGMFGWPTVPADIEAFVIRVIVRMRNSRRYGQAVNSESFEQYSYSLASEAKGLALGMLGEDGALIARYAGGQLGE